MANTKHSVAREMIIDRLLHKRRGYSIYEMLDIVNKALEFEGYGPVTINTIRRDIDTIRYRYKQCLHCEKRSYYEYFRYEDPNFTIYNNVLTYGEIQHIHSALMSIRWSDAVQGTLMYKELSDRLSDMLDLDPATDPIVIYEKIPSNNDLKRFQVIYEYIRTKSVARVTYKEAKDQEKQEIIIHPYFLLQRSHRWILLGHDATNNRPVEIPLFMITRMSTEDDVEYVPNNDFDLKDFYTKHFS